MTSQNALSIMLMLLAACAAPQQPNATCSPWPECTGNTTDTDGDGILDLEDNCPNLRVRNISDDDGDNIGDFCDNCVNVPNDDQADEDDDGFGDVCDTGDNVPTMLSLVVNKEKPRTVRRFNFPPASIMPIVVDVQSASDDYVCVHLDGNVSDPFVTLALNIPQRDVPGAMVRGARVFVQEVVEWSTARAMRYDLVHVQTEGITPTIMLRVDVGGCIYSVDPNFVPPTTQNGEKNE